MKKILSITLLMALSLPLFAGIHTYADQSVLSSGRWVKIRVSESGVCRMTFEQLQEAGLNPRQLRVFGFGGAMLTQDFMQPKIDDLPQVPVYVGSDYVLFWVQGPVSWSYDGTRFAHTRNTYSDYGYYFLTDNTGDLLAPTLAEEITGTPAEITTYPFLQVHDKDSINLVDRSGVSGGGRDFYGEQFNPNQKRIFTFATPNAVSGEKTQVYVDVAAMSGEITSFRANINSTFNTTITIKEIESNEHYTMANPAYGSFTATVSANSQQVQLTYQGSGGALGWLNYIELATPSNLRMTGSYMPVRTTVNYRSATPVRFHLTNANSAIQIWDITDLSAIRRMPATLTNGELQWTGTQADGIHEYVAVNTQGSSFVSATVVGSVKNQNLHRLKNIDYVTICPEGYEAIATDLAKAHEQKQAITWAVVTDQQVYNEFSSGTPDASAYRWLMKMLYDRADGQAVAKPRWLLLMGHGTFDNRKLLPNSGTSLLLTYQAKNSTNEVNAYASDDYFTFLEDNEGEEDRKGTMDISVGRLPVNNTTEARETVDKIIRYMRNENAGKWKSRLMYLADDGENGTHTETAEESAERIRVQNPDFIVTKIFLDAYPQEVNASGESYPIAKNKVASMLKNGVLFFDYSGHGGYNAITNESILNQKEIEAMRNENLAFWLFVTCNFAQFDTGKRCAAESAVLNPKGGAVSILSASRTVFATYNTYLNRAVCKALFSHSTPYHYNTTLGEAIAAGKNELGSNDSNKLAYVLLGDPALLLNFPTDYHIQTVTPIDTLNALSVQQVEGQIVDEDETLVPDFNGTVDITIYDKIQTIPTRDNDKQGGEQRVVNYKDYTNVLFSGQTPVENGLFKYTFMVPKDIRYNYGNGRIVYYARTTEDEGLMEAVGHDERLVIGGTGNIVIADTTGPEMTIYLNTPAFKDGDKTYSTPRFFADLHDEHGINTAGAGIGHDLMLVIDEDAKQTYSLNDYFTAEGDSYQRGQVSYLMNELPDGAHSLTFRAWDMLNNSTTKSLSFIVEAGLDPSIYSITSYPNPVQASGVLNLVVNYDQPDELLQTEVYLYNTNGQMIWKQTQENPDRVAVNIAQLGLMPGVYFYAVRIKSETSKFATSTGKIIVTK
ncbi:MAG: type IX secretion system sortase PorU [Paludibacteraceae bacterium]|nr:type IX secretion system sortase PorU [Paludibacteraceae bacterium]